MDFFDPQKQKRHAIRLAVGYAVIGVMLTMATTILLYRAYGFGLDKNGQVIQNGLVFVSSQPSGSEVYLNGAKYKSKTNARMDLPSGQYLMEIKRDGYRNWKRAMTVEGGSVERFDYPVLFPAQLTTTVTKQYAAAPGLNTESLDRRWLLVATPTANEFDIFDMDAKELKPQAITVPTDILAAGSTTTGWQLVEWSKDNKHVLLGRSFDKLGQPGAEYILLDRENPALSQNLTVAFGFSPTKIELRDQAYDQYYLFDQNSGQVFTANLKQPTPQPYLSDVLAFTSEKDTVAYATAKDAPVGKILIDIRVKDSPALAVRQVPAGSTYLLDMAVYSGNLYLAAGASAENRVFLYQDPIGELKARPKEALVPVQILKVDNPNYVTFSTNKRIVMAENADRFAVYDAETDRGYVYQVPAPMDAPQTHALWMDGFHLAYVSGGKAVAFDYDGTNLQALAPAVPGHLPVFDRNYRYMYTINASNAVTSTALLISKDL